MRADWYIQVRGGPRGPFSFDQLKGMALEGRILRDTLVRRGRNEAWIRAVKVEGLVRDYQPPPVIEPPPIVDRPETPIEAIACPPPFAPPITIRETSTTSPPLVAVRRPGSAWSVWFIIAGVALLAFGSWGVLTLVFLVFPIESAPNAQCPTCDFEFNIPEVHRGTVAEWTREYRCPNCNIPSPPNWLYMRKKSRTEEESKRKSDWGRGTTARRPPDAVDRFDCPQSVF